jgi:hypothetical protein
MCAVAEIDRASVSPVLTGRGLSFDEFAITKPSAPSGWISLK